VKLPVRQPNPFKALLRRSGAGAKKSKVLMRTVL
jgi:hypothetical protein